MTPGWPHQWDIGAPHHLLSSANTKESPAITIFKDGQEVTTTRKIEPGATAFPPG